MANGVFNSSVASIPAVQADGDNGANGVNASSDSGAGVNVFCVGGTGVLAQSVRGIGVSGISDSESPGVPGVFAQSRGNGIGLHAVGGGATPSTTNLPVAAIFAEGNGTAVQANDNSNQSSGIAVQATSEEGYGVYANSTNGFGVFATTDDGTAVQATSGNGIGLHAVGGGATSSTPPGGSQAAIFAEGGPNTGVNATSSNGTAVFATDFASGTGLLAQSPSGIPVHAVGGGATPSTPPSGWQPTIYAEGGPTGLYTSTFNGTGVHAEETGNGTGVGGDSDTGIGVSGYAPAGIGVQGQSHSGIGVKALAGTGTALQVQGTIEVQGNSAGTVAMAAGTKTLTVSNAAATANSLIFLTPLKDPQVFLWIGARSAGSFTIDASKALPAEVTIGFLIIN